MCPQILDGIPIIAVVDIHLTEIYPISLVHRNIYTITILLSVRGIEDVVASNKVMSTRKNAHVEILKVGRLRMREGRKGEHLEGRFRLIIIL